MEQESVTNKPTPKLMSIGSVSAASLLINGFYNQRENLTAVVPTTDTGSSTGIIRKKFSMPAPGDVRAVLAAMGEDEGSQSLLKKLNLKLVKYIPLSLIYNNINIYICVN